MLFTKLEDALLFGIKQEDIVIKLYKKLLSISEDKESEKLFEKLIGIEEGHKEDLRNYSWNKFDSKATNSVYFDLEVSDYETESNIENLTYLEVLLLAAKRESLAVKLYTKLSEVYKSSHQIHNFFFQMIEEEERHKYDLELMILEHKKDLITKMKFKDIK